MRVEYFEILMMWHTLVTFSFFAKWRPESALGALSDLNSDPNIQKRICVNLSPVFIECADIMMDATNDL